MKLLSGFIVSFVLLSACHGAELTTVAAEPVTKQFKCPGSCVAESLCTTALNNTDCTTGLVCCLDASESTTDPELTTWSSEASSFPQYSTTAAEEYEAVVMEDEEHGYSAMSYGMAGKEEAGHESYDYIEESGLDYEPLVKRSAVPFDGRCFGTCVPHGTECQYILTYETECSPEGICCLNQNQYNELEMTYHVGEEIKDVVEEESEPSYEGDCPGVCLHPAHGLFCEQQLPEFYCPMNLVCCVSDAPGSGIPSMGTTSCGPGTICCMKPPTGSFMEPPTPVRIPYPTTDYDVDGKDGSHVVLGHLALDEDGVLFKVGTDGTVFDVPELTNADLASGQYEKLMDYPHKDGMLVIYSDSTSTLYQWSSYGPSTDKGPKLQLTPLNTENRRKERNLEEPNYEEQLKEPNEALGDIVLPDEDDEEPVIVTKSAIDFDNKTGKPVCPGSCVPYHRRFTCSKHSTILNEFSCPDPRKSVCCAAPMEVHKQDAWRMFPLVRHLANKMNQCGLQGKRDASTAVAGELTISDWCWQVAVINVQNQYMCGGGIIGDMWVITAAHCVIGAMTENQALFIRAGVTDLKSPEDNNNGQTIRVVSTFVHHNFNSINLDNNIALLRLQKPLNFNNNVCMVCMPTSDYSSESECVLTGYGFLSSGEMLLKLNVAPMPIADDTECMTNVTLALGKPFIIPESSLCAGGQEIKGVCQGDAGGVLACKKDRYYEVVGLASWNLGCDKSDVPSVFVKVFAFERWISNTIASSSKLTSIS
ncbi:protein masquerade [Caerostris darwini]|uniref:Protein masquerade n=1 Tax=Caerostris darwini TaxID=1538125 RepID=A0AAV4SMT4_9ARAC|nr:protein masquerade [Caerostris darwini]